jgi:hypothetical protein
MLARYSFVSDSQLNIFVFFYQIEDYIEWMSYRYRLVHLAFIYFKSTHDIGGKKVVNNTKIITGRTIKLSQN